jgi:hypothetical protein
MEAILVAPVRTALRLTQFFVFIKLTLDIVAMQEHCVFCSDPQGWLLHLLKKLRHILCRQKETDLSLFQIFNLF